MSHAEPTTEAGKTSRAQEGQEAEAAEGDKEEGSGGQDKSSEGEGSEDSESSESGDDKDDEQEGEEEGAGDDMHLAWEMLEQARLIYNEVSSVVAAAMLCKQLLETRCSADTHEQLPCSKLHTNCQYTHTHTRLQTTPKTSLPPQHTTLPPRTPDPTPTFFTPPYVPHSLMSASRHLHALPSSPSSPPSPPSPFPWLTASPCSHPPSYPQNGGDAQWASPLADVHLLLGELSQEREQFEGAVEEFSACARLLTTLPPEQALRRWGGGEGRGEEEGRGEQEGSWKR